MVQKYEEIHDDLGERSDEQLCALASAGDAEAEAESENAAAEALRQVLAESPQILLYAVCFGDWEETTHAAVTGAAGLDLTVRGNAEAEDAGGAIAGYYDSLYVLEFPLSEYVEKLALRLSPTDIITVQHVGNLNAPPAELPDWLPGVIDSESEGGTAETEPPQETPEPSPTPEPAEPAPAETVVPVSEERAEPPEEAATPSANRILFAATGGALVLVIVLLILLLIRRNKGKNAAPAPESVKTPGIMIPMRLEMLSGMVQGEVPREFVLSDSFFIGNDRRCDLILSDASVSPVNTRVYYQDGSVYIEDLNSMTGTALGGMRIYAPNRLRSGEDILVGQCCFRLYF